MYPLPRKLGNLHYNLDSCLFLISILKLIFNKLRQVSFEIDFKLSTYESLKVARINLHDFDLA